MSFTLINIIVHSSCDAAVVPRPEHTSLISRDIFTIRIQLTEYRNTLTFMGCGIIASNIDSMQSWPLT